MPFQRNWSSEEVGRNPPAVWRKGRDTPAPATSNGTHDTRAHSGTGNGKSRLEYARLQPSVQALLSARYGRPQNHMMFERIVCPSCKTPGRCNSLEKMLTSHCASDVIPKEPIHPECQMRQYSFMFHFLVSVRRLMRVSSAE